MLFILFGVQIVLSCSQVDSSFRGIPDADPGMSSSLNQGSSCGLMVMVEQGLCQAKWLQIVFEYNFAAADGPQHFIVVQS